MEKFNPSEDTIRIFDTVSHKDIDILQVALIECAGNTHIPELYEIFGKEAFLKFLDIFSGSTIVCPSRIVLEEAIRNVGIFLKLEEALEGSRNKLVKDLAIKYGITSGAVRKVYMDMEDSLRRYKFRR